MPSPIADLSYRNYDGPLLPVVNRWWAIAKMSIQLSIKKKGFWVWAAFSGYWYVVLIIALYFIDRIASGSGPFGSESLLKAMVWKDQFLNAFSVSQLFLFIIALLIGAGTIANDNRANALLVYLSKPCSKLDYVVGKWIGIFLPITAVSLAPTLFFYAYGFMSYRNYGFFSSDPWLLPKLIGMCLIPGTIHASLSLGVSSLFNQGRLAGATYAGVYFMSLFFTNAILAVAMKPREHNDVPSIVGKLFYCSIDGIQIGLAKLILGTDGSGLFNFANGNPGRRQNRFATNVAMPSPSFIIPLVIVVCAGALLVAWRRVRAVEVVG